jgi:hypothetical protein
MQYETGRTGYDTNAPKDTDNDFLCAVQLQRIANALEEVIRLVKQDQEKFERYKEETTERWDEPKVRENPESIQTK